MLSFLLYVIIIIIIDQLLTQMDYSANSILLLETLFEHQ